MGISVTKTYKSFEKLYDHDYLRKLEAGDDPLDFDNLFAVHRASDSYRIDALEQPMLILSASGMCTAGRILHHLEALLPKPETDVIFVGWQAPGSHGYEIQHIKQRDRDPSNPPEVILNGRPVPVRAHITTMKGISAHADRRELAHWFSCIPQVRILALNHGDREAQERVTRLLNENALDRRDADGKKQDAVGRQRGLHHLHPKSSVVVWVQGFGLHGDKRTLTRRLADADLPLATITKCAFPFCGEVGAGRGHITDEITGPDVRSVSGISTSSSPIAA